MPVFLEGVLEDCASVVVGCYSKEWILALGGLGRGGGRGTGEGADEGILEEVVGIASVQEVGF